MNAIREFMTSTEPSRGQFAARLLLVAVQLVLGYCLAGQSNPFFYQAF